MSLTDLSLRIGGGIVLFLIALRMIFPHPDGPMGGDSRGGEPLIVPLAIPALAGPSALATVMLLTSQAPGKMLEWIGALTVTMIVCAIVLMLAEKIQHWLGERAVTAFERLMGLVLVAISVEMMLAGYALSCISYKKSGRRPLFHCVNYEARYQAPSVSARIVGRLRQ